MQGSGAFLSNDTSQPETVSLKMRDRPFIFSGVLGIGVILVTLVFNLVGPRPSNPLPNGHITPVLAFELATSEAELAQIFGAADAPDSAVVQAMDRVNRLDYVYISLYGLMLFLLALVAGWLTGSRIAYVAAALAFAVMMADILENLQLLAITAQWGQGTVSDELARLHLWTWLKWAGLAAYFLLLAPIFWRDLKGSGRLGRVIAIVALLPAVLTIPAYLLGGLVAEVFALSTGLVILLLTLFSWRRYPLASGNVSGAVQPA